MCVCARLEWFVSEYAFILSLLLLFDYLFIHFSLFYFFRLCRQKKEEEEEKEEEQAT